MKLIIWNEIFVKTIALTSLRDLCLFSKVPIVAMAIFGGLAAILTLLCDIHTLAEFLSIGTLIAFTIVCMNVCILRYCNSDLEEYMKSDSTIPKFMGDVSEASNGCSHICNLFTLMEYFLS